MSESKHTPGPWHVEAGAVWAEAQDGANLKLASIHPVLNYVSMGQRNDNARLIAAAPELLEALKNMAAWAGGMDAAKRPAPWPEMVKAANGAIAKAEGRE